MKKIYTVMIAEDEEMILNSIRRNVESCDLGFKVIGLAQDGQQMLDFLKDRVPNVLMTDIQMPIINGLELAQRVETQYPDVLKVIISGYDKFEYAKKAINVNVQDYLLKPVIQQDMMKILMKLRMRLDKLYKNMVEELNASCEYQYSVDEVVGFVEEYLKNNYKKNVNFELLAESFNYNSVYLSRAFSKKLGISPSKYLIHLRINKAKQLLINNSELSVRAIGGIVGYPEQPYFCRIFKNTTNVTPLQFRTENKSSE